MMRRLLIAALIAAPCIAGAATGIPANWTRPMDPVRLFDGVWWVGTEGLAAYLFDSGDGLVLLDVGMPENAEAVLANIRALGFDPADVEILLNSHAHFDHSGGLAAVKRATGARLVAAAADVPALETGTYPGWEDRAGLDFPPVTVDRRIADGETVTLGDLRLTAHVTPGHSEGCTSWAFTVRAGAAVHDALVFCSASVALNRLAPEPQYPGIVADYRGTFARLRAMDVDVWLTPHAEQFDLHGKLARRAAGAADALVDPAEKDRRMAAFERAFVAELARQRRL